MANPNWSDDQDLEKLAQETKEKLQIKPESKKEEAAPAAVAPTIAAPAAAVIKPGLEESENAAIIDSDSPLYSATSFGELGLRDEILKGVYDMGFKAPSRIQGLAIPAIIQNPPRNFIGQAQSGTGKTGAFSLSILSRVDENIHALQAVVVSPTRELSRQIYEVITKLAKNTQVKTLLVIPENDIPKPITQQIAIGTPGKLIQVMERQSKDFKSVRIFVLDEADVMLDMQGFQNQTIKIHRGLPKNVQVCLFSATYDRDVQDFANQMVVEPRTKILIPPEKLTLDKLKQFYIDTGDAEKRFDVINKIYGYVNVGQSIIFTNTREMAKKLTDYMKGKGHEVSLIHGNDMDVKERDRVIDAFKTGAARVLITTNVLARGIDVRQVSLVVNFDVCVDVNRNADPETYLHRIGRSARYGAKGVAINFVYDGHSRSALDAISRHFAKKIDNLPVEHLELIADELSKLGF